MSDENAKKKIVKAVFNSKEPKQKLKTTFCSLERYDVVNHYNDKTTSQHYDCDILLHKGFDAVGILPYLTIDNKIHVLLISNFRAAAYFREAMDNPAKMPKEILEFIEIPAGVIDKEDHDDSANIKETIKKASARELSEECGYDVDASAFEVLGSHYYAAPGILAERIYISTVNITGKKRGEAKTDGSVMEENIKNVIIPLETAIEYVHKGIIKNAVTEIAISRLHYKLVVKKNTFHNKIISKRLAALGRATNDIKKESEYYNRLIRQFRATITHELRHPFTEIMNYLNIITREDVEPELRSKSIDILKSSIRKIYDNNNNMLSIAFGVEMVDKSIQTFNVHNLISNMVKQHIDAYKYSNIDVNIHVDKECQKLIGFKDIFYIIIEAVISNALKFTKQGSININVKKFDSSSMEARKIDLMPDLFNYHVLGDIKPHEIEISIKDTGIGMNDRMIKNIFKPFFQGDSTFNREYSGMGIGLSVVRNLLESIQGTIDIDSDEGVGTTVVLNMPFGLESDSEA